MKSRIRNKKGRLSEKGAAFARKKIIVEFPERLYARTEDVVRELGTNRSALIRSAVEQYLDMMNKRKLERELAEGYMANAALNRQIAEEFAWVDSENI